MKKILLTFLMLLICSVLSANNQDDNFITHTKITSYSAKDGAKTKDETPINNAKIKSGVHRYVAVSRDLEWAIPMGSIIEIEGMGKYEVHDTCGAGVKHTIDILIHQGAENFKHDKVKVKVISKPKSNK